MLVDPFHKECLNEPAYGWRKSQLIVVGEKSGDDENVRLVCDDERRLLK
jgi:hypothetical protein